MLYSHFVRDGTMQTYNLDGGAFLRMLNGGVDSIKANSKKINDLNVFPVPDGDTGSNMTKTFEAGFLEAKSIPQNQRKSLADVTQKMSHGMLLGARGNSGVILSQIFKGIQLELKNYSTVNAEQLLKAYEKGVEQSYHAVVNPVEGTILTVFREATEYTKKNLKRDSTIEDFYKTHIEGAKLILPKTKEILDVLKDADVIDSGGAGYLCIAEGMYQALLDKEYSSNQNAEIDFDSISKEEENTPVQNTSIDISAFTRDSVLEFGYCTECLLRLQTSKVKDVDNFDINIILNFLNSIGGESVVAFKEDDIVKLHVHTENPGLVLTELRKYGEFLTIKVENMALQHEERIKKAEPKKERLPMAVVAVANGDGLKKAFTDFGCDYIIDGGQTGNPAASAFVEAFDAVNADNIIVLPNNSNIVLTAKQAAEMYKDSKIYVVPTKSIQQGYSALAMINPAFEDIDSMVSDVEDYIGDVISGNVALAVRDAELCGKSIKEGDYLGMFGDDIVSLSTDKIQALEAMLKSLDEKTIKDKELLTLFCGQDVSKEEAQKAQKMIESHFPDLEVTNYQGNQKVYSFLVGIE